MRNLALYIRRRTHWRDTGRENYQLGWQYGCVVCGGCCEGTLVGSIKKDVRQTEECRSYSVDR